MFIKPWDATHWRPQQASSHPLVQLGVVQLLKQRHYPAKVFTLHHSPRVPILPRKQGLLLLLLRNLS